MSTSEVIVTEIDTAMSEALRDIAARLLLEHDQLRHFRTFDLSTAALVDAVHALPLVPSDITLTLSYRSLDRTRLPRAVADAVDVPVIASGGVGGLDDLADGVTVGHADAVLAASIFHYGEHTVGDAKRRMAERGIPVRLGVTA